VSSIQALEWVGKCYSQPEQDTYSEIFLLENPYLSALDIYCDGFKNLLKLSLKISFQPFVVRIKVPNLALK